MQLWYRKSCCHLLLFLVVSCFLLNSCQRPIAPADKWQSRVLAAHGGAAALARISTIVFRGRIATRGDRGTVVLILSRPGKLRTTMKYTRRYEDRILLGSRGWRNSGAGFEEVAGHSLDAMIFQYNHLNLPMGLMDGNYKISYSKQKIDEKVFPALELSPEVGPSMTVLIDPETGLIHRVDGRIAMGTHGVVMGVGYSDYRQEAGVMLPHRIVNYVNGNVIAESQYDTVEVNTDLDPNTFTVSPQALAK